MDYFDDLEILTFNYLRRYDEKVDRVFRDRYALNYAHSGGVYWRVDSEKPVSFLWPVAYWTWPGPRFRYGPIEKGGAWEHRFVSFRGPRVDRWVSGGLFPTKGEEPPFIRITDPNDFCRRFDRLLKFLSQGSARHAEAVHALEGLLLWLRCQPPAGVAVHPMQPRMRALLDLIEAQPEAHHDFNLEAAKMAVSIGHLRRMFRLFVDQSPVAFVNSKRMEKAARLLRETSLPVKQVAADVGIPDVAYFSKRFTRAHDLPPAAYRRYFLSHDG